MLMLRTISTLALVGGVLAQAPARTQERVVAHSKAELAAVDPATQDLQLYLSSPDELAPIARLERLQHLVMRSNASDGRGGSHGEGWREAGADALRPLGECRALRSLSIGYFEGFDPACLRVVGELPQLGALELTGVEHRIDRALVSELAKLGLRKLMLTAPCVIPDAFPVLCELPLLEELRLELPLHLRRCDLSCLSRLRNMRRIELRYVGSRLADTMEQTHPLPGDPSPDEEQQQQVMLTGLRSGEEHVVLDERAMRALASLPLLLEIDLTSSVVTDALMATLPTKLMNLDLRRVSGVTPAGIASLRRLADLQVLGVDSDRASGALAEVLPDLSLVELHLGNGVDATLCAGLMKCDELQYVEIWAKKGEGLEFDFLAKLPKLQRVTLAGLAVTRANYVRDLLGDDVDVVVR